MIIYKVGGAVRDQFLGKEPSDIDYVVTGATHEMMDNLGYKLVGLDFLFICTLKHRMNTH